jgi:uncharacterized RDD family membrane protein YckC
MTQSPDHPQEQHGPEGVPPAQGAQAPMPPAQEPYPSAPPISEPYGGGGLDQGEGALAGRWRRLLAAIIDGIVVGAITWIITAPTLGTDAMTNNHHLGDRFAANGIMAVIGILYFGFQHGKWGQSIGKRALGMRVVRAADGGPIGYGAAFLRVGFTYILSTITLGFGALVDVVFILWDRRKQALHDKVAKTVVVNADGPDPYAGA